MRLITSAANDAIKGLRALRDRKGRREQGLFLAEGLRIAAEALDAGHTPALLVITEGQGPHPLVERLAAAAAAAGGDVIATTPQIMARLVEKENPQAVLAAYRQWDTGLERLDRAASPRWLVAEGLRDPGNLGTMLRTCDACAAGGLILLDNACDPFSVEAVRASMGALFTVPVARATGEAFLTWLRAGPGELIGTSLRATDDYRTPRYRAPAFVFMGNEQSGLSPAYEAACDRLVRMPMLGRADSLNVAVASAVMLYEAAGAAVSAGWGIRRPSNCDQLGIVGGRARDGHGRARGRVRRADRPPRAPPESARGRRTRRGSRPGGRRNARPGPGRAAWRRRGNRHGARSPGCRCRRG